MTDPRTTPVATTIRFLLVLTSMMMALSSAPMVLSQALGPAGPSPASGTAAVIAQGVFEVPDSLQQWQVSTYEAEAGSEPIAIASPAFIMARTTPLLVTNEVTGSTLRIAHGEAAFLHPGDTVRLETFGPPDTFVLIELTPEGGSALGSDPLVGQPFQPLAGTRDIDLVRDVLDADDTVELPEGAGRTLVVGLSGQITARTADGGEVPIAEGDIAEFDGPVTFTGVTDGAEFVAAYIGAVIGFGDEPAEGSPEASPTAATPEPTQAPTEAPATPEPTAVPATPEATEVPASPVDFASPEASPEAAEGPFELVVIDGDPGIDTDADGLTVAQEEYYGTDPADADSDVDGINDYRELVNFQTDPLNADADDDGMNDYNEIFVYETDPNDLDSDGDILYDGGELIYASDPTIPDTDRDGLSDGEEVYFALTDPADADSDDDGINDYNEIATGTDPLDPASPEGEFDPSLLIDSDGDVLTDPQEVTYETDPANPDTDGDGVNDDDEIKQGTDPTNAESR
jgi:hypothetical protein